MASSATSFSIKGLGLKLDSAEHIQPHLDALKALGEGVEEIHLGGNTLGVEACKALADVLPTLKNLKVADFADIFTGRLISEIPDALTALCNSLANTTSLETIDLSDNAFGGRCAEPIVPFLTTNLSFSHFILNNNGLGPTGGNIIAEALLQSALASKAKGQPSSLRTIVCGRNRLENGTSDLLAKAFAEHGLLTVVRLPQNGIRMEGIAALAAGLALNPNLHTLDLQDNTFTLPGSLAVSRALPVWKSLKELNISDCFLTRKGGITLATALENGSNPDLEVLRLQYGEMDKRTFEILAKAIKVHLPKLKTLELNGNLVDAEDESVEQIRAALEAHGHEDALDELDDMEEDEGEEEDEEEEGSEAGSDAEDATKEADKTVEPTPTSSSETAPAAKVPEEKSILEFSVDDMADALSKMSVVKDSA